MPLPVTVCTSTLPISASHKCKGGENRETMNLWGKWVVEFMWFNFGVFHGNIKNYNLLEAAEEIIFLVQTVRLHRNIGAFNQGLAWRVVHSPGSALLRSPFLFFIAPSCPQCSVLPGKCLEVHLRGPRKFRLYQGTTGLCFRPSRKPGQAKWAAGVTGQRGCERT